MMKKLFFCLSLLSFLASSAQIDRPQPYGSPKTNIRIRGGVYIDSVLYLPLTQPLSTKYRIGALMYQQADSSLYTWTGFQWLKQAVGGAGAGSNLGRTITSDNITITNDNGSGVIIPKADGTNAGLVDAVKYNIWDSKLSSVNIKVTPTPNKVDIESSAGATGIIPPVDGVNTGVMTPAMLTSLNGKISSITTQHSITGLGTPGSPAKLVNDALSPGSDMVYGTNASGVKGWKPDPSGGGGGSQDVVNITAAGLESATGLNTSRLYNITDSLKQGTFYYVGTGVNKTGHNGGTIIIDNNNNIWKRIYRGSIDPRWFGASADGTSTGNLGTGDARAIITALAVAANEEKVELNAYNGNYYNIDTSVTLSGQLLPKNLEINANLFIGTNVKGFIIDGYKHRFVHRGWMRGLSNITSDSTTNASMTGEGIVLRNANDCYIEGDRITNLFAGIHTLGENVSSSVEGGSQYNQIHFTQIRSNHYQLWFTIDGTPSNGRDNWANENWYYGRLGGGTGGASGGTVGIKMEKLGGGSNSLFETNKFFCSFEGLYRAVHAKFAKHNIFSYSRLEDPAITYKFYFEASGSNVAPSNKIYGTYAYESWFEDGGLADGTMYIGTLYSASTSVVGEYCVSYGGVFTALNITNDPSTAYSEAKSNIISFNNLDGNRMDRFLIRAKINGKERHVPFLYGDTIVTAATFTVPASIGTVWANRAAGAMTITMPTASAWKSHELTLRNIDLANNVNVNGIFPADISIIGPGEGVRYRSDGTFWRAIATYGAGGGGGSITLNDVGSSPNSKGATYASGALTLQPADSTNPGVLKPGPQNLGSAKTLDSAFSRKLIFRDVGAGFTPFTIYRTKNGLSFGDPNGTANPNGAITDHNFSSGTSLNDMVLTLGKAGTNSSHLGTNSTDFVIGAEKTTGGIEFRNGMGYSTMTLASGALRGKIFGSGNWLIQSGGVATDAGYKLDVQGTMRVTGVSKFDNLIGADTRMAVINADGTMGTQTIPTGGSGGSSIFTAGAGTGSPQYRTAGAVNIGINPSQSWAWTTWGPSCTTCGPSSSARAIWEFSPSSVWLPTPRNHSLDYNLVDIRFTNGTGQPAKIITEITDGTLSGDLNWQANDIGLPFVDPGSAAAGDEVIADVNGLTTRKPRYKLEYSQTSLVSFTNTTANTDIYASPNQVLDGGLAAGDVIVAKGFGLYNTAASGTNTLTFTFEVGTNIATVTSDPLTNALAGQAYSYEIRIIPVAVGSSVSTYTHFTVKFNNQEVHGGTDINPSLFSTTTPLINVSAKWNVASTSNTLNSYSNTIEVFRK